MRGIHDNGMSKSNDLVLLIIITVLITIKAHRFALLTHMAQASQSKGERERLSVLYIP
jgi:hypothetical protein